MLNIKKAEVARNEAITVSKILLNSVRPISVSKEVHHVIQIAKTF